MLICILKVRKYYSIKKLYKPSHEHKKQQEYENMATILQFI